MKKIHSCLAVIAAILLLAPAANAIPTLKLSDGVNNLSCADGASCDLLNGTPGAVAFAGSVGAFAVNVTTGLTNPPLSGNHIMDLNSVNVLINGTGSKTLTIEFSNDAYTNPWASLEGLWGGTGSSGVFTAKAYYDLTNTLFNTQVLIGSLTGGRAFSGTFTGLGPGTTSPYSLTQVLNLKFDRPGHFSADFELNAVPEPASLALLGIGLIGLGFSRRKRA